MAIKILIVEYENEEAKNIKRILESLGYEVPYTVYNGEEAVKTSLNSIPDLVLIDIKITGKTDGIDAAAKIKELDIPVIYLISNSSEFDIERAIRTAPYGYINKPIDRNELRYMVELSLFKNSESKNLKASEEKYRRLVENSSDMIYLMTIPEGKYEYVNSSAENVTGYTPDEFYKSTSLLLNIIHPDYKDYYKKTWKNLLKDEFLADYEYKIITKSGEKKWLNQRNTLIKDRKGNIIAIEGIITDITDNTFFTKKLKTSIKEKDILLREIHHRVKNNMQIISSLLSLQMTHLDNGDAVDLLKESQNRVRSMAIIHDKLYQSNDFTKIDLTEYIKSLVNGLFYSYSIEDHINSSIDVDDVLLNIETAVPFGLILNELISNSLKHGFPGGRSGELYISLKFVDDKYELIVGDTGIGFPEDIDFKKTDSLGLQLVNNLVNQIDGEIELNTSHGTEYKIIFKELKYKERI